MPAYICVRRGRRAGKRASGQGAGELASWQMDRTGRRAVGIDALATKKHSAAEGEEGLETKGQEKKSLRSMTGPEWPWLPRWCAWLSPIGPNPRTPRTALACVSFFFFSGLAGVSNPGQVGESPEIASSYFGNALDRCGYPRTLLTLPI